MAEIEVPSYFLCPISLQIMKDPVTLSTGITYDRDSIEEWIFSQNNATCPLTKQPLSGADIVTPNITLRRLIQSWCALHASDGVQRLPTPKAPVTKTHLLKLLEDAKSPQLQTKSLQKLRSIASRNHTNKRCMETAGAPEFLASLILNRSEDLPESRKACEEAIAILYSLRLSESQLKSLTLNAEFVNSLTWIMQDGSYESRAYAVMLLESMLEHADPAHLINLRPQLFAQLVRILKDEISQKASKATLKALASLCPWGKNRIKAVGAGATHILIDILLDSTSKRECEMILTVLDYMCQCAEGRAELLKHGAGLAIVAKKILRVSHLGSEKAVRILYAISKFSATPAVLAEMLQIGVVTKLCLVIQVECGLKTKERAVEMLRSNGRAWRNSKCIIYPTL